MKVREPVARPLDVVGIELLLSAAQAFLMGVLMYLAVGIWDDRGVGSGTVAVILALLGLAVGAGWLYWLMGGVGWPMAAANTPVAMFLGFALVLGHTGDAVIRVEGIPLVIAMAAAIYGIAGGVFVDSPRRWRWDQRQRLRPGTAVPRVSATTRAVVASVPRSLPRRAAAAGSKSELAARIEASTPGAPGPKDVAVPTAGLPPAKGDGDAPELSTPDHEAVTDEGVEQATEGASRDGSPAAAPASDMPTARLAGIRPRSDEQDEETDEGGIELPTAIEPRAQRSPWAWAAPPEWNRDEDDEPLHSSSSRRS